MEKAPGIELIGQGILWILGGVAASLVTYILPVPIFFLFWGACIYGFILLAMGVFSYFQYLLFLRAYNLSKGRNEKALAALEATKIAMIAMAQADGNICNDEIVQIKKIHQELTGIPLSKKEILRAAEKFSSSGLTIGSYISSVRRKIEPNLKELVLKTCIAVMVADGKIDDAESIVLGSISKDLGINEEKFENIMNELFSPSEDASAYLE